VARRNPQQDQSVQSTRKILSHGDGRRLEDEEGAGSHAPRGPTSPAWWRLPATRPRDARVSPRVLFKRPQVKNVGLIVVTTDKGLCGGLNTGASHRARPTRMAGK
jgi:hypothetical protein